MSKFILTYSGSEAAPYTTPPSLEDIAVSLVRQPRFAGHTRYLYNVLDHSLFVMFLAERRGLPKRVQLAALLHDAHEAITADVPAPVKPNALRAVQDVLDYDIMMRYFPGGILAYRDVQHEVRRLDYDALLAEAAVLMVLPGDTSSSDEAEKTFVRIYGAEPASDAIEVFESMIAAGLFHPQFIVTAALNPLEHPSVEQFVETAEGLAKTIAEQEAPVAADEPAER